MHSINSTIFEQLLEITNNSLELYHSYYNTKTNCFELYWDDSVEKPYLIITPCIYNMKGDMWREFYSLLDEEQTELARSYPFKRGYMDYLREIGLYDTLKVAEENVTVKAWETWLAKNKIDVSEGIVIDDSNI